MTAALRRPAQAVLGRRARLRWVHLLLGGALLMPYYLLVNTLLSAYVPGASLFFAPSVGWQFATFGLALAPAAVTALHPLARPMVSGAARALCGVPKEELDATPARSWAARGRTATWYVLHLLFGGIVSGMSLATPPAAVVLMIIPLLGGRRADDPEWVAFFRESGRPLAPLAGLALLALVVGTSWAAGALLARWAPVLLGPTPADRLAAAEQHAMRLALRNRLARELHDSVGHALSAVSLQASAARRVLDSNPEFAWQALAAIEETTRDAVGELDTVLGLLREDGPASAAPAPTLTGLDGLLQRTRAAGATIECTAPGGLEKIPPVVSREAYRIVQEGLSNALRHAGGSPIRLRVTLDHDDLEVTLENPLAPGSAATRRTGGRGLTGIAERARLLRGSSTSGETDGVWRLSVRLPLRGDAR
ncbi:sensor histidine kinase [Streptomyces sp. NPDC053048]|uniref:sensor histidine kinase n=1 Tax=Streptomyces sp. NPDC053048 TaxID=3365694 RepID=UPI0037D24803